MSDLIYGINPVREALHGGSRSPLELMVVRESRNSRLEELIALARSCTLKVTFSERRQLDQLAGHAHHQGVVLRVTAFAYRDFDELLSSWRDSGQRAFFLLLDGITDPHNFGAILRSAEIAGCSGVVVAKDRSCPVTPVVEKTAAGALAHLPLCQVTNLARTVEELKKNAIWCYGLAGEDTAEEIYKTDLRGHVAIVVGSEGSGLRPNIRNHCDGLLAIPMKGSLSSLNASVAAGIALFEVVRQNDHV